MIPRLIALFVALWCAAVTPQLSLLRAQDPPATTALGKQELARAKFKDLTERMQKLMSVLQKSEPEDVKLLAVGVQFAQEKKLQQRLDQSGGLLRQERWDEALVVMGELKNDLGKLLELLQNRNTDLRKLLEEIAKLQAFRDRVDELAKEQGDEKDASARTEELQRHLADLEAKKQQAQALLGEQKAVRERTNELGLQTAAEATQPLADKEAQLAEDTEKLAKDLEQTERKDAELKADAAAAAAKAAAEQAKAGAPKDGAPKDGKPNDAKPEPTEPKADESEAKPATDKSAPGKSAPGQPTPGKPGSCSGSAGKAAKAMGQAQQKLGDKQPEPSLKDQDQAIENLQRTVAELEAMAEEAKRELLKLPMEQQAKKQDGTQHATDTLAKDMEKAEAEQQDDAEAKPTPGKKRVQQAVPKQRAAAGQLKEYKPAKQKQQDAKEDLEAAKKELEDALAQLRQQLQDEVLRALEERFTAMLARQRELSAQTRTLDGTRGNVLTASGQLPAALVTKIGELATGEAELESESADALKLLEEDATTAVFPPMVEQLRDDLGAVAARLRKEETGAALQQAQREVEDLLAMLINALRKTIEMKEGGH
jgi:hypothetical protein